MVTDGHGELKPSIFDYESLPRFIQDRLKWLKGNQPGFSLRNACKKNPDISQSLLTRIASGQRKLTLERVPSLSQVLSLASKENSYLQRWVMEERIHRPRAKYKEQDVPKVKTASPSRKACNNHILENWLNVYVKDAARVKGFSSDPLSLYRLLGGIASPQALDKSLKFLLKNGYLRKTMSGQIVENDAVVQTSDDIPNAKIQQFHRRSLDIAKDKLENAPWEKRRFSAVVLPVNDQSLDKLKDLLQGFLEQLHQFAEEHAQDDQQLYQVLINLSPVTSNAD